MPHLLLLILLSLSLLTGCGNSSTAENEVQGDASTGENTSAEKLEMRISHVVRRNTPKGIGAQMLKRQVNTDPTLSKRIEVKVYPESVLYTDEKVIGALFKGKIQLAIPSVSIFATPMEEKGKTSAPKPKPDFEIPSEQQKIFDKFDIFFPGHDIPNSEQQRELIEAVNQVCSTSGEKQCLKGLAYWHNGMKQLSIKTCPDDKAELTRKDLTELLKDKKLRTQNSKTLQEEFKRYWQANAEHIAFADAFKGLKKGSVIGQENTWSNMTAEAYYKVQDCFIETNHGYLGYLLITTQKFWEQGLTTEEERTRLTTLITEISEQVNEIAERYNENARNELTKRSHIRILSYKNE